MWLLESDLFEGRKLWLRPGKLYLFGRTAAEPGQLAVSDKTISRKHITIKVDNVPDGAGRNLASRSTVTIEDLDSKKGTLVNGVQIRGQKKTLEEDENAVKLGMCNKLLRIHWHPVVLSFSFTAKELRADPWTSLRDSLEQLDIKYSADFDSNTSHVVSKKRNTSKGLQALISGKYIVTDSFINAIADAAAIPEDAEAGASSALEGDFDACWPNPLDHLPPRGEEPVDRPPEAYSPDTRRQEVFDGYTFVFYESKQYENLFPVIAAGKGKALLKEVIPGKTDVDGFVRYVKSVAGEKGLGSFEDGSVGKGVVVVRYTPKSEDYEWFAQFLTSFAQRLDHRPIDQREFLEAILACDASMLRRPLQEPSQPAPQGQEGVSDPGGERMDVDEPVAQAQTLTEPSAEQDSAPPPRRGRARRAGRSRFKGFDFDDAEEPVEETPPVEAPEPQPAAASQDSLFVSQHREASLPPEDEEAQTARPARRPQRKRALSPLPEHDNSALMDEIAPTAAAAKRRRIKAGQEPVPPPPEPEPAPPQDGDEEMVPDSPQAKTKKGATAKGRGKKIKQEDDILELARRQREEAEALAAAKRRELEAELADGEIDYRAIRALHIIEECEVRLPDPGANPNDRSRDQDIADGRWDPRWNGRKNFKRFRRQGEQTAGRAAPRVIVELEEVRPKEYGIGDDYWLEKDDSGGRARKDSQRETQSQSQSQLQQQQSHGKSSSAAKGKDKGKEKEKEREKLRPALRRTVLALDSSEEEEEDEDASELGTTARDDDSLVPETEPSRSRAGKAAERANSQRARSQAQTQSLAGSTSSASASASASLSGKRPAAADSVQGRAAAKRPRRGFQPPANDDDEDSDGELKFRFGRRR